MKPLKIGKLYYYQEKPQHSKRTWKVYGEYRDETLFQPIFDLADGDICCVVEQLPSMHSCSVIAKIILQNGIVGFVLISTVIGSLYSLTEFPS